MSIKSFVQQRRQNRQLVICIIDEGAPFVHGLEADGRAVRAPGPAALNAKETEGRRRGGEIVCKCGSVQINNSQFPASVTIDIGT